MPSSFFNQIKVYQTLLSYNSVIQSLPCLSIPGNYVLVWQKGQNVLTAQSIMVTPDPRFKLASKHNLQIRGIRPSDAGDYVCKISLMGEAVLITHTLEILGECLSIT